MKKDLQQFNTKTGSASFSAKGGKCRVVIKSRFVLTPDQIEKLKLVVDRIGYEDATRMNTMLVQVSLLLLKWFPRECNHVTVGGETSTLPITKKECLTITIE